MMKFYTSVLDSASTVKDIYPSVSILHNMMAEKNYSAVDEILGSIPTNRLSNLSMVSIVRTTYAMKRHLSAWYVCRDKVGKELSSRGEDTSQILRGLYTDDVPDCAELHKLIGLEAP